MVLINCGSAIATLPGANWATPLGKLKTTTFFMLTQNTRVVQHDAGQGEGNWDLTPCRTKRFNLVKLGYSLSKCYWNSHIYANHKIWSEEQRIATVIQTRNIKNSAQIQSFHSPYIQWVNIHGYLLALISYFYFIFVENLFLKFRFRRLIYQIYLR